MTFEAQVLNWVFSQGSLVAALLLAMWFYWYKMRPEQQKQSDEFKGMLKETLQEYKETAKNREQVYTDNTREREKLFADSIKTLAETQERASEKVSESIRCLADSINKMAIQQTITNERISEVDCINYKKREV